MSAPSTSMKRKRTSEEDSTKEGPEEKQLSAKLLWAVVDAEQRKDFVHHLTLILDGLPVTLCDLIEQLSYPHCMVTCLKAEEQEEKEEDAYIPGSTFCGACDQLVCFDHTIDCPNGDRCIEVRDDNIAQTLACVNCPDKYLAICAGCQKQMCHTCCEHHDGTECDTCNNE